MAVSDYSTTPSANTLISGINIGEGCPPANINDAIRQMMADLAASPASKIIGTDIQAYNAKLAALAALTLAADKLIYATGTNTLATSDLTAFARTLLAANDLAAIWTLLYLGALAGKSKISVPGDINASGTAADWSALFGDGSWRGIFAQGVSWQDFTASRVKGTNYQNTTGRPIKINIIAAGGFVDRRIVVSTDGTTWRGVSDFNVSGTTTSEAVVPIGHYYRFEGGGTVSFWLEMRP